MERPRSNDSQQETDARLRNELRKQLAIVEAQINELDQTAAAILPEERYAFAMKDTWATAVIFRVLPIVAKLLYKLRSNPQAIISDKDDATGFAFESYRNWLEQMTEETYSFIFSQDVSITKCFSRIVQSFSTEVRYRVLDLLDTEHSFYSSADHELGKRSWRTTKSSRDQYLKYMILCDQAQMGRPLDGREVKRLEEKARKAVHVQFSAIFLNDVSDTEEDGTPNADPGNSIELASLSEAGSLSGGTGLSSDRLHHEVSNAFRKLTSPETLERYKLTKDLLEGVLRWYEENLVSLAYGEPTGDGDSELTRPTQSALARDFGVSPDQFQRACAKVPKILKSIAIEAGYSELSDMIGWLEYCQNRTRRMQDRLGS